MPLHALAVACFLFLGLAGAAPTAAAQGGLATSADLRGPATPFGLAIFLEPGPADDETDSADESADEADAADAGEDDNVDVDVESDSSGPGSGDEAATDEADSGDDSADAGDVDFGEAADSTDSGDDAADSAEDDTGADDTSADDTGTDDTGTDDTGTDDTGTDDTGTDDDGGVDEASAEDDGGGNDQADTGDGGDNGVDDNETDADSDDGGTESALDDTSDSSGPGSGDDNEADNGEDVDQADSSGPGSGDDDAADYSEDTEQADSSGPGSGGRDYSASGDNGSGDEVASGEDKSGHEKGDKSGRDDSGESGKQTAAQSVAAAFRPASRGHRAEDGSREGKAPGDDRRSGDRGRERDFSRMYDDDGFEAARGELLALVDDGEAGKLAGDDLTVTARQRLDGLGMTLVTLAIDEDADIAEIALALDEALDDGAVDFNHTYEPETDAVASGAGLMPGRVAGFATLTVGTQLPGIGMIDTEIDSRHPTLEGADVTQRDFVDGRMRRPRSHGTAVASILTGKGADDYRGLIPGTRLFVAGVFFIDRDKSLTATTLSLIRALDWLIQQKVSVINMSLAGPPNRLLERAINKAAGAGFMIVAAAGNDGPAAPPLYPAAYEKVIAVTAVDGNNHVYRRANRGQYLDFSAPGVRVSVARAGGGYRVMSGTSMATPFVSAVLASRAARGGVTDWARVVDQLHARALDLGRQGFDSTYGYGLIRAASVVAPGSD